MDKPLSLDTVNQMAGLIYQLPPAQAEAQALRMREEQPILHAYLSSIRRENLLDDEFGYIVSLGLTIWLVLEQAGRPAGRVTETILLRAMEQVNASFKGVLAGAPEEQQARTMLQFTGHPEPGLLAYLVAALYQKADPPLSQEATVVGFYRLCVVLEALLASRATRNRPRRPRTTRHTTGRA